MQSENTIFDRLNRDDEYAPGWRPEIGDSVIGVIVDIGERESEQADSSGNHPLYPILTIAQDDNGGNVAIHCFHSVLKSEVAKNRPVVGDRIGVKYLGVPQGKRYQKYRVIFERPVQPDYSKMEAEAQAELAEDGESDFGNF